MCRGICARQENFHRSDINEVTNITWLCFDNQIAPHRQTHRGNLEDFGVMWMRRLLTRAVQHRHGTIVVRSSVSLGVATPLMPLTCAAPITDYDSLRQQAKSMRTSKIGEVRQLISKLQKAQQAGEDALDLYGFAEHDVG